MPKRIQMRRTKGWRKPEGAVYVGRPTKWGNQFRVGTTYDAVVEESGETMGRYKCATVREAVDCYENYLNSDYGFDLRDQLGELKGKDLACWCPLDQPCHADVLLEMANGK